MRFIRFLIVLLLAGPAMAQAPARLDASARDPDGLYDQMRLCLAQKPLRSPCMMVDRGRGFVVIKDDNPSKSDAFLIVPDTEITGIEDPKALRRPVLDFWSYGWQTGKHLLARPAADIGLAVNSKAGRTQNLLHIHISCARPAVRAALDGARIGPDWATYPFVEFRGHAYNARKLESLGESPFLLLRQLPGAREDMAAQSLAVIGGATGEYYLLSAQPRPGVAAAAEELLDERCD